MSRKWLVVLVSILFIITIVVVFVGSFNFGNSTQQSISSSGSEDNNDVKFSKDKIYVYFLNNELDVFIKGSNEGSNQYIGYNIRNLSKELDRGSNSSNYDVWKLAGAGEYARNGNNKFKSEQNIVLNGEWEMAIREKGANDFVGGSIHGDEITTSVQFFLNGEEIENGDFINDEADEFKIVTTSDLYRDNTLVDDLQVIGEHEKVYIFNRDGLTLEQGVTFHEELQTDRSYLTMLPILRTDGDKQITDTVVVNDTEKDISSEDFEVERLESTKATITGEESGITATVEILDKSKDFPTTVFVMNSPNYNKLYFSYQNEDYYVSAGEVWEQTTHFDIDTAN